MFFEDITTPDAKQFTPGMKFEESNLQLLLNWQIGFLESMFLLCQSG